MNSMRLDTKQLAVFQKRLNKAALERDSGRKLEAAMVSSLHMIVTRAQTKYLTSGPLHTRTGRLRASVKHSLKKQGDRFIGTVGTDVFYGRVWEWGAQTPGHIVKPVNINPKTGRVFDTLRFRLGPAGAHGEGTGPWTLPKQVKMAPKPWLAPAVKDMSPKIRKLLARVSKDLLVSKK